MISFVAERDGVALDELAEVAHVSIAPDVRRSLLRFAELVGRWGQKTDLVKASSARELAEVLFLDALMLSRFVEGGRVLDVGAGAGAPTVPLVILTGLSAVLLEPRRKRVAFLRSAVGALKLAARVEVRESRLEQPPEVELCGFDLALSRATFAPQEWLERGSVLAQQVVVLLAAAQAPQLEGWVATWDVAYAVPSNQAPRRAVCFARASAGTW